MSLPPGTTLGPYSISAKIDEGGMGEVYKARDTRLDRTVALKVLAEHVAATNMWMGSGETAPRMIVTSRATQICRISSRARSATSPRNT